MKNKKLLLTLSLISTLGLAACGGQTSSTTTSSSEETSSVASSVTTSSNEVSSTETSSSEESSSSAGTTWKQALNEALAKDYSNMTVTTIAYSPTQEATSETEYYYDDYQIIQTTLFGSLYTSYYHDYDGKSYQWFDGDATQGEKDGWLTKGYDDAYVGLGLYSYLDARKVLACVEKYQDFVTYSYGTFYLFDDRALQEITSTCFMWCPDVSIDTFFFTIDSSRMTFKKMGVFDTDIDTNQNQSYFTIENVGTTEYSYTELPAAPTSENVLEYWQYKGWSGPSIHVYPTSLTLTPDENVLIGDNNTYTMEIEKSILLSKSINYTIPDGVEEARLIKETGDFTFVSSDDAVAVVDYNKDSKQAIIAVGAGDAEIYATCTNEKGETITSNKIKVHVNKLPELNKEGATFDITFDGLKVEDELYASNAINNNYDFEVLGSEGVEVVKAPSNSTLFADTNTMIMRTGRQETMNKDFSGGAAATFDFKDHKVKGITFYYGQVYDTAYYPEFCQKISIETSLDGTTWTEVADITSEVKADISTENFHLIEKSFTAANQVRIVLDGNFIGKTFEFSTANVVFIGE